MKSDISILILHGWNLSAEKFTPLVSALRKKGYEAEAIDLPGFGKSETLTREFTLSDYVHFVDTYIVRKKWKKVVLIGHSFGGRISIKLAAMCPQYLLGLVLTGTPGYNPVPKIKIVFFLVLAKLGNLILSLPLLSFLRDTSRKLLYRSARATDFYNTNKNMRDTFKQVVKEDLSEYMGKIKVPTLLLWGVNDQITPVWIGQKMQKSISKAQFFTISNARHGAPWTHTKEFIEKCELFLKKLR